MRTVRLVTSPRRGNKLRAVLDDGRHVDFGAIGYSDYTLHRDPIRWANYKRRHRPTENWGRSGIGTAGFWARWILWNLPSVAASVRDTERRFGLRIVRSR